jgi:hypothetical protein
MHTQKETGVRVGVSRAATCSRWHREVMLGTDLPTDETRLRGPVDSSQNVTTKHKIIPTARQRT